MQHKKWCDATKVIFREDFNLIAYIRNKCPEWLRHHTPNAGGMSLIPGQGTKIPHAAQHDQKKKKERKKKRNTLRKLGTGGEFPQLEKGHLQKTYS